MTSRTKLMWVAALLSTYVIDGKAFGPSDRPIEVPESLAVALGLPAVEAPKEGEVQVPANTASLQTQVDTLTKERDDLKKELDDLKENPPAAQVAGAIPADARERLTTIQGIGEKLADKVLEVLTAEPQAPAEETPPA